jgi:hypothetical protein
MQNAIQLRAFLSERFPRIRLLSELENIPAGSSLPTGLTQIDALLGGGLPKGALTEMVQDDVQAGSSLVLCSILHEVRQQWVGLIDGRDSFDPASLDFKPSRLLWIRCHEAAQAMKAADLLLRDGNLPLVLLDLALNPAAQLRKISATAWYRLQRLIEHKSTALLVITPRPMVSSAKARLFLTANFTLDDLGRPRDQLLSRLKVVLQNKRFHSDEAEWAQAG